VEAEIDEELFQIVDLPHPEERDHVPLEHTLYDVLAQDPLAVVGVVAQGGLGKTADQQVALELREENAKELRKAGQLGSLRLEQVVGTKGPGDMRQGSVPDLQELEERPGRHGNGDPPSDAAVDRVVTLPEGRRAGRQDPEFRPVIE